MQDTTENLQKRQINKRFRDQLPIEGSYISNDSATDIHDEIENIKRKLVLIDTAFLRDDLQAVDYPGHRLEHADRRKSNTLISEYKSSGTKVIIGIIITFTLGLFTSGIITRISEIIK